MSTTKYVSVVLNRRSLGAVLGLLLALSLGAAAVFADTNPPAAAGQSGVLVNNYWGQPMDFNIGDTEYMVPANGQLFIPLPAGDYTFSANAVGNDDSARSGELVLAAGQRIDLGFAASVSAYVMSVEAASTTPKAPPSQTTTQSNMGTAASTPASTGQTGTGQAAKTGILVKNYWGLDLTFNVADTMYDVPSNGQLFIPLSAGDYTYSANANGSDNSTQNGDVTVVDGHTVVLSSYLNSPYTPFIQ